MYQTTLDYFLEMSRIPRESKHEEKISARLVKWANEQGYEYQLDTIGNIIVSIPATQGRENDPITILQAHMDMVCVKTPDSDHNFATDPIEVQIDDDIMTANGTTLGADNGIGLAMCMSAVDVTTHGPLELLFTVDEEQGLTGAIELDASLLQGKRLINLDTEDLGEICISSAGGARIDVSKHLQTDNPTLIQYLLRLGGLKGGHSGVDIDKKRGNAIIEGLRLITSYTGTYEVAHIKGGVADNALPGYVDLYVGIDDKEAFAAHAANFLAGMQETLDAPDAFIDIQLAPEKLPILVDIVPILSTILSIKQGIHVMSEKIPGLVQTSINLGMLSINSAGLKLSYAARSSVTSDMDILLSQVEETYKTIDAEVNVRSRYPGRQEDPESELVQVTQQAYTEVRGQSPEIVAYHAGLECGAIVEKLGEGAQAVSFGPTIKNPHSPDESCDLASVRVCCEILERILAQ